MFFQNIAVKSHRKALCDSNELETKDWCRTKSFRMSLISSNNPDYFITKKGYVICKNDFGYNLMPAYVSPHVYLSFIKTRNDFCWLHGHQNLKKKIRSVYLSSHSFLDSYWWQTGWEMWKFVIFGSEINRGFAKNYFRNQNEPFGTACENLDWLQTIQ